jgi:FkbM family methyltransferase
MKFGELVLLATGWLRSRKILSNRQGQALPPSVLPSWQDQTLARLVRDVDFIKRRTATYLGEGIALTCLADESPILVNANDYGGPMNLLGGGVYEMDNLEVLFSYLKPDSVVLDIGANLGFFSLQLSKRLRGKGHVHAFEPHPGLQDLANRTIHVNGLRKVVTIHGFGLSDSEGPAQLLYPRHHLGGGRLRPTGWQPNREDDFTVIDSHLRRLDDVLPDARVDLVKIDVEGHELRVLRGMRRTIKSSATIVILFEKLREAAGYEANLHKLMTGLGLELFGIQAGARLEPLDRAAFERWRGYALAVRPETRGPLARSFFAVYPSQLQLVPEAVTSVTAEAATLACSSGSTLFHGPYWFLPMGYWTMRLHGKLSGRIILTIQSRLGIEVVARVVLDGTKLVHSFYVPQDLVHFECVAAAASPNVTVVLEKLMLTRHTA